MSDIRRIAIITGGSRGMGRDAAIRLAHQGVSSIITYNSRQDEAEKVVTAVREAGAAAVALQLDVGRADIFDGFVTQVRNALASLGASSFDYLVNNAGASSTATLQNGTEAELDAQFAIHFKGPFLLTQKLLPLMNNGGRIVNISSGLARFSFPGRAIYGPMKAAVEALTRYMALELGERRIAVNVVAPGAIATDFSGGVVRDNPEVAKALASHTALGRVGGPEDVGPVIAGLLSNDFGGVNGQRIEVTGGFHL
ncbi:SDR family NAD(P)-dependent oxidoreductase [Sphingobium lignivorans]|uniref:NAD(P)-dependent dehydrogenase (Short-subunit alcohol dehydrogenase family) n=1 Tax=Sphingobium lignivorans TaxID=2735886 RepID=A0ABR6NCH2_9SPHN|nr:SDR family oxidoreductase [Sphingobium lignivorans]MBB5984970.1 NAD(P)-dependent dehydrogenase (short-subunit alcohol dehydrogenase family) [Sphingobium lignivorans]